MDNTGDTAFITEHLDFQRRAETKDISLAVGNMGAYQLSDAVGRISDSSRKNI